MVNSHLVCDPTIQQLGFDLPRQQWSLLNCFCTEQGHCGACRRKWRLSDTDLCPCGETQRMSHIVEKLNGCFLLTNYGWMKDRIKFPDSAGMSKKPKVSTEFGKCYISYLSPNTRNSQPPEIRLCPNYHTSKHCNIRRHTNIFLKESKHIHILVPQCAALPTQLTWSSVLCCRWTNDVEFAVSWPPWSDV